MATKIKDGGPAFPVLELNGQGQLELAAPGASLRDYFIAHAPAEPQPWFQPVMPEERPNTDTNAAPEHLRADVRAYRTDDYSRQISDEAMAWIRAASKRAAEWDKESEKRRYIQWPAAWADAMLAARENQSCES